MPQNDRMGQSHVGADAANFFDINIGIADLSAEASYFAIVPFNARLVGIMASVDGAIATADATITPRNAGTTITAAILTMATAGSAAGSVFRNLNFANATANAFTQGQAIELLVTGAGAGGTPRSNVTLIFERTAP